MAQQEREAESRLDELQTRLGLRFKRRELLREAMTHTSWINERGDQGRDNERLEYLGDAVLELVAGEYLFNRFPNYDEGQLTQMRSSLVSTVALARLGEQLMLGETLRLGRGAAKSGARRLTSLHANAFEALIGAIFLDQGYRKAGRVFLSRIEDLSAWTDPNFKGRLQALAQERFGAPPQYRTVPAGGDPRTRQYVSQVSVDGQGTLGEGRAGTKQAAEQAAARAAIDLLVAPVSKKRRRRSRPAPSAAASLATTAVVPETTPASSPADPAGPSAAEPTAPSSARPEAEGRTATTDGAGSTRRPSRRRTVAGQVSAASKDEQGASSGEAPAPKPRRRRSSRAAGVAVGSAASEPAIAVEPELTPPVPEVATSARRRRRRSPAKSGADAAQPAIPMAESAGASMPQPVATGSAPGEAAEPTEGAPKRRTHRGHRGGRRRSGRGTTAEP